MIFEIFSRLMYLMAKWSFRIPLLLFFGFRVKGVENLPNKGAFIFASNHVSYMDPGIIGAFSNRQFFFITSDHLYKNRLAALWYHSTGCIRIKRGRPDHSAMKKVFSLLRSGKPIAIFPEGTRSADGQIKGAFLGIGFMALKARVPVIPCLIKGSDKALPRGAKNFKFGRVEVAIGSPIPPTDPNGCVGRKEAYRAFSIKVMDSIAKLDKITQEGSAS
ncbi:MAG: lysophospholipid acyltransferase family protein [Candidatus Omnitrophota bacterium]